MNEYIQHALCFQVRGPATIRAYFKSDTPAVDADNWFSTGDVATIDALGHMTITDRSKDVIKSGGEWISSIEIENLAMVRESCMGVLFAFATGIPQHATHARCGHPPLACPFSVPTCLTQHSLHTQRHNTMFCTCQVCRFHIYALLQTVYTHCAYMCALRWQGFPGVGEAAVVAIPHERWGERPLLCVVPRHAVSGGEEMREALIKFLEARLAK